MSPDVRVARLASRQRGVVTRAQLHAAGLTASAIRHRVRTGRFHPFLAGSYLVGHATPAPLAAETATMLVCGRRAVLSHQSAAALWGMGDTPGTTHVTLPRSGISRRDGIRIHRVARLAPVDRRRRNGFPVTAPARTLLDLAAVLSPDDLDAALERARVLRLVRPADVRAALDRTPKRRGAGELRRLLDDRPTLTRSRAERLLGDLVRRGGLPRPQTNAMLEGFEVDLL